MSYISIQLNTLRRQVYELRAQLDQVREERDRALARLDELEFLDETSFPLPQPPMAIPKEALE